MESLFSGFEAVAQRFSDVLGSASSGFRDEVSRVQTDVASTLADAAKALVETTAQSRRDSEAMFSQIGAGASSFRESIETGAAAFVGELDRGSRSIDDTVERLSTSVGRLQGVVDQAEAFARSSADQTGQRIIQLNDTLSAIDSGFRRVGEAAQPFANAADQVRSALELLQGAEISVQAKIASLQTAATAILSASEVMTTGVRQSVDKLTGGLGSSSEALTDAVRAIANEAQSAGVGLSETIRQTLKEYEDRFLGIDRELQTSLERIIATFHETYEDMRERINEVDGQMASSVNKLVTFNDNFEEHLEELTQVASSLANRLAAR
jgi:chromosome segregation ATPase